MTTSTVRIVEPPDDDAWENVGRRFGVWASLEEENILVVVLVEAGVRVKSMEPKGGLLTPFIAIS